MYKHVWHVDEEIVRSMPRRGLVVQVCPPRRRRDAAHPHRRGGVHTAEAEVLAQGGRHVHNVVLRPVVVPEDEGYGAAVLTGPPVELLKGEVSDGIPVPAVELSEA